ncbi:hypothetical protein BJX99DRAFT_20501 [Aspergillus californicus]
MGEEPVQVTAGDLVNSFTITTSQGGNTLEQEFYAPCIDSTQLILCQAYHLFVITSISLFGELVDEAHDLKDERNGLQDGFNWIYNENAVFVAKVAPFDLPLS